MFGRKKVAGISMRSRALTAACTALIGTLWVQGSAYAGPGAPLPNSITKAQPAPRNLRAPANALVWAPASQRGMVATPFSFSLKGLDMAGSTANALPMAPREVALSAALSPGIQLDLAGWHDSALDPWSPKLASVFGRPLLANSAWSSPYAGPGSTGNYVGATFGLARNVQIHLGRVSSSIGFAPDDYASLRSDIPAGFVGALRRSETDIVGLDWSPSDWSSVALTASRTREAGSALGTAVPAGLTARAETSALGISARVGFGEGWVTTIAYSEGVTQLDLNRSQFAPNFDSIRSQAFGFAVAKEGLFGDDSLGIAVSRPLQVSYGTALASAAPGATAPDTAFTPNTSAARESDIQLGYVTTFLDGALALQANAAYQVNANGDKGQDAVSVLSRAKIKF